MKICHRLKITDLEKLSHKWYQLTTSNGNHPFRDENNNKFSTVEYKSSQ